MSEIKRVKIQSIVESQIPEFLNNDSPIFKEFLEQYYISQEHQTGVVDLAVNLQQYKSIDNFNTETFYSTVGICTISSDITSFDDTILVNHTIGFPQKYGLLKIDDEIITYTGITTNSFTGCVRGFSGMDQQLNNESFVFSSTVSSSHNAGKTVTNLNLLFFNEIFKKFKIQFLPGFEDRKFVSGLNLKNILSRAKDFYTSKGTDVSYKILFSILFGKDIQVIKPQDYLLRPSDNNYLVTKNILVEQIVRDETFKVDDSKLRKELKGKTIFETLSNGRTSSSSIYNVEYRPVNGKDLYEISLDSTSFIFKFESTKKTNISESVNIGSTAIMVDSTVGFKNSGSLFVKTPNLTNPISLKYTDKTLTEFLGVSGVIANLNFNEEILEENFLYSYLNDGTKIEFRLINIINNIDYSETSSLRVGDKIQLSEFGTDLNDREEFNFWNYNVPTTHKIKSIDGGRIYFYDKLVFIIGDKFDLFNPDDKDDVVISTSVKNYGVNNIGYYIDIENVGLNIAQKTEVRKKIRKASSALSYFPSIIDLPTGVQNTYIDYNFDNFYVTSSGLPNDEIYATDRKIKVAAQVSNSYILDCTTNHNFYTGEKIHYTHFSNSGIETSVYFLKKIDENKISLSHNNSDLYNGYYINFSNISSDDYFVKLNYQNKTLEHQKIFKKFNLSKKEQFFDIPEKRKTINKKIGILADGVELFSPTIFQDNIYYGKLESVNVNASGQGYDVINFSGITVEDNPGFGSIVNGCITGSLDRVKLLSPGIGYRSKPKITLTGGNGSGAILESNLVKTKIISNFNSEKIINNTVIFTQNHNFDNLDEVLYANNSNISISPLIDGSSYFVGVTSTTQIKLYNTKNDSISGINTISISGIGYSGVHSLKTINSKNTITKIYVKNGGSGYSNRYVSIPSILSADNQSNGVNTFDDYIFAKNHNFKNEDLILYTTSDTIISGLSTQINYHITVVDENKFKLSVAGVSTNISRENYINKKYVSFDSVGVGTHKFSYPPIEINVEAISGITTTIIEPSLDPIVLGSFDNIFIENNGKNYGTPDIINFHRKPLISVKKQTSQALLRPVISDGLIVDVQILNAGNGYSNDIDIVVVSESGKYAELYPTIVNGKITQVSVINSGINYDKTNTKLDIEKRGSGARFEGNVFEWQINQIEKNKSIINSEDEGIIIPNDTDDFGLQFVNYYPSKKLRKNLNNFINEDGTENEPEGSTNPYQILGWAYDGNPIFGPYGKINGTIKKITSSYTKLSDSEINNLTIQQLRPDFIAGFFVEDFYYDKTISNGDLDEYNGMFIDNNNFPNIKYGYFFTIDGEGNPQYPYLIGPKFKDTPVKENFEPSFNQEINLNELDIVRNTGPYFLNSQYSSYSLIDKINSNYKQEFIVKQIQSSGISSVSIYNSGEDYKSGDDIIFDDSTSGGTGISAVISKVRGKDISNIQIGVSTFSDVTFITKGTRVKGITGVPHNLITNDEILVTSISSSPYNYIQGSKKVLVNQKSVGLINDIPNQSTTGPTTYITVNDVSGFEVDNLIKIDTETLKVINISYSESKLFVNRYENYTGIHTAGIASVVLLPNVFTFNATQYDDTIVENKTIYFNPSNTIGIGTSGTNYYKLVGIKTDFGTINASIPSYIGIDTTALQVGDYISGSNISAETIITSVGIGSIQISPNHTLGGGISIPLISFNRLIYDKFVPSRSIYIPNHKYYTGQSLTYNVGLNGTGLTVSNTGTGATFAINQNQTVYAVNLGNDYVGLSTLGFTTTSGIGSTNNSLYFQSPISNIGLAHSLTAQYSKITGTFENYSVTVSTAGTHGLQTDDKIKFNIFPSFSNTVKFRYDTTIRKITTDKIDFDFEDSVDTQTSEITIVGNNFKTGDKVVYYSNDNPPIGGLSNNNTYYILKQHPNKIKLSNYLYDTKVGTFISFTSASVNMHSIALINPPINLTKGNILNFDLSDSTVGGMEIKLYKDPNFVKEIESFKYLNNKLDTKTTNIPNEIYYNLIPKNNSTTEILQISYDREVIANNRIKIVPSTFNNEYPIIGIGSTVFKFNLKTKPENTSYTTSNETSSIFYDTNSTNTTGGISKIKINFGGKGYSKLPKISTIETVSGKNAILKSESSTIGKVIQLERIKDGFNYPTDNTLRPFLSSPIITQIKDISRIDYIGITTGGKGYNVAPSLKVIGNNNIKLSAELQSGSIVAVKIIENTNNLITPLRIVPTNNSNGYEIENIVAINDGSSVTLELLNDTQLYPFITTGYGKTETVFPFAVGDEIFIEKCRQVDTSKDKFNSKDYDYGFFTVTAVSLENFSVTFSMSGLKSTLNLNQNNGEGNYINDYGYGFVINKKDMPEFDMVLIDDLSYISGEKVIGITTSNGNIVFFATVMENGWDNNINQLRLIDAKGELEVGNKLKGEKSLLNGTVEFVNKFNLKSTLGETRDKVNDAGNEVGFLNNYQQRISDNSYYQKFSYAIKSEVSYDVWKEPVRSIIHPAGFKEFSDLDIISKANKNLKVGIANSTLDLLINLDDVSSFYSRNNFSLVTEDEDSLFEDGSIERVSIGADEANVAGVGIDGPISGIALKPYTLSKTNKVLLIDDISSQFTGSNEYISIASTTAIFDGFNPYYINLSTNSLNVGDYVGFSTLLIPDNTVITEIGIGSVRLNLPHKLNYGSQTSEVKIRRRIPGNTVIGNKSFSLTSNGTPLFYREFNDTNIDIDGNIINLSNHNFQTGQKILYDTEIGTKIGVNTTSLVEPEFVTKEYDGGIIMGVSGGIGSAIFENGYNVAISTTITGISTLIPYASSRIYGFGNPIPAGTVSGVGTGAKFEVWITYDGSATGNPISTSIVLKDGGRGYAVGNTVSIAGTYLGGENPTHTLSFNVSKVSSTKIVSEANSTYAGIAGTTIVGVGSGASFNISRDSVGAISSIEVLNGGRNYEIGVVGTSSTDTDIISIAGTYIGGSTPADNLYLSPTLLGTDILPKVLYVDKLNDNQFRVSGLSTSSNLDIINYGVGTQSFTYSDPNSSTLIAIDNIIQSPLYRRGITLYASESIGVGDTVYLRSGISSLTSLDVLLVDSELMKIRSVGIGSTNDVIVDRAYYGTVAVSHTVGVAVTIMRGDFNIVKDAIYFTDPPYGKIGQESLQVNSSFQGRFFSRRFDPGNLSDKNLIIDDISKDFTGKAETVGIRTGTLNSLNKNIISGIDTTSLSLGDVLNLQYTENQYILRNTVIQSIGVGSITIAPNHNVNTGIATTIFGITRLNYILKSNGENISGLYSDTNSSSDINNNPFILLNNVSQISDTDFIIDTTGNNTIKFISGIPNAGRIVRVGITTGYGYQPLVGASATVSVSAAGTISNIYLTGAGSGYRIAPVISIASTIGSGATITASIGAGGTVTSLSIVNAGTGYTTAAYPKIKISIPSNYSNLGVAYTGGSSGAGEGAKVSVIVGNGSSVTGFTLEDPGYGYKVGDTLSAIGITTNPSVGVGFSEFRMTVEEVFTDKFSGFYPGQFVRINSLAPFFTGKKRKFLLTVTTLGTTDTFSIKSDINSDLKIENNFFIFINDILQKPQESYIINGSRIIFSEAPKANSKCLILYYRGSDLDVDDIDPPRTIKEGDSIQIGENILDPYDREQFERVVKKIISFDSFDTFPYDSIGINTDTKKARPLNWTKQTRDRIINGVLYTKGRPDLKSRNTPTTRIIKSLSENDIEIYVNNAFPLFVEDDGRGLKEELRDIIVLNNKTVDSASGTANVSLASTISSITIINSGSGYEISNPTIIISSSLITRKDPIYNWSSSSGITTNYEIKSITYGNIFVGVGSSGLVINSEDGINWSDNSIGYGNTLSFNSVAFAGTDTYVAIGQSGKIVKTTSIGSELSSWDELKLTNRTNNFGVQNDLDSLYDGEFKEIVYSSSKNTFIAVGKISSYDLKSPIFTAVGIGSTEFFEKNKTNGKNLNSIAYNNSIFVAVGDEGTIYYSFDAESWSIIGDLEKPTTQNLNKIVWDGYRFISVGNNGTIITSQNGINWSVQNDVNITNNLTNTNYYDGVYVILDDNGNLYYSFDLSNWEKRSTNQANPIRDLIFVPSLSYEGRYIVVGSAATIMYSEPIYNRATATSSTTNGIVTSVSIINGGFGYSQSNVPPVIFESAKPNREKIYSIKAKGDFGTIVGINTIGIGGSSLEFKLESETYDNATLGIGYSSLNKFGVTYSQLERGDYFVIYDSNVTSGYALTGITTTTGIRVGTATSFIDGLYRVENVISNPSSGIVTVRCDFVPVNGGVDKTINLDINSTGFYGRYTWGKIYDYQNRARENPKNFIVNTNDGLVGLSTASEVYRTRGLI
jgi:photosystem II stability/assembly factor-like uncharacterized protein